MSDHRELLKKYIAHVMAFEGSALLGDGEINPGFHGIGAEDISELRRLGDEVMKSFVIGDLS